MHADDASPLCIEGRDHEEGQSHYQRQHQAQHERLPSRCVVAHQHTADHGQHCHQRPGSVGNAVQRGSLRVARLAGHRIQARHHLPHDRRRARPRIAFHNRPKLAFQLQPLGADRGPLHPVGGFKERDTQLNVPNQKRAHLRRIGRWQQPCQRILRADGAGLLLLITLALVIPVHRSRKAEADNQRQDGDARARRLPQVSALEFSLRSRPPRNPRARLHRQP